MIPTPVYESLPVIYAGSGLLTITALDTVVAFMSGGLLIAAALLVGYMRVTSRFPRPRR